MENSNNTGKILGALLIGGAIGGVLGLLFAPAKGSDTRKNIISKGNDLSDAVKEKLADLKRKVEGEVEVIKERTASILENGKAKI